MGMHFTPPPAAVSRVLASFDRDQLAGFIAVAIDLLDFADGDLDVEANGDELDGHSGEDEFNDRSLPFAGAGCPIADAGEDDDPGGGAIDDVGEEDGRCAPVPVYGVDQTAGPINEHDAGREHQAKALGLVRSPTGGWRWPS